MGIVVHFLSSPSPDVQVKQGSMQSVSQTIDMAVKVGTGVCVFCPSTYVVNVCVCVCAFETICAACS